IRRTVTRELEEPPQFEHYKGCGDWEKMIWIVWPALIVEPIKNKFTPQPYPFNVRTGMSSAQAIRAYAPRLHIRALCGRYRVMILGKDADWEYEKRNLRPTLVSSVPQDWIAVVLQVDRVVGVFSWPFVLRFLLPSKDESPDKPSISDY